MLGCDFRFAAQRSLFDGEIVYLGMLIETLAACRMNVNASRFSAYYY